MWGDFFPFFFNSDFYTPLLEEGEEEEIGLASLVVGKFGLDDWVVSLSC